jgi:hypothetical protein
MDMALNTQKRIEALRIRIKAKKQLADVAFTDAAPKA